MCIYLLSSCMRGINVAISMYIYIPKLSIIDLFYSLFIVFLYFKERKHLTNVKNNRKRFKCMDMTSSQGCFTWSKENNERIYRKERKTEVRK